jgi:hypothetical protein
MSHILFSSPGWYSIRLIAPYLYRPTNTCIFGTLIFHLNLYLRRSFFIPRHEWVIGVPDCMTTLANTAFIQSFVDGAY